ncbi:type 4a pilus biogenesis protein PilO [candidate division KSB1 bacterium]|nr:type 4a pilus biogenesis protein PilO [candidate division KSB1 bacterium]
MAINLRNQTTQKWIIVCTLTFGVVYAYLNFVHTPRADRIAKIATDIDRETELLAKGKRIAANFRTVEDDYARLMQSWQIAQELLPTQREMEGLLKSITLAGQENDLNFLLFRPQDPLEQAYYWENPIQIKTRSTTHNLGEFMSAVAALDRIVNVSNLKLTAYKPAKGRSHETVDAEFVATIYIFKSLGSPVTVESREEESKGQQRPGQKKPKGGA